MKDELAREFARLSDGIGEQYTHLSPVQGFLWANNEICEKHYKFGGSSSAITKVIHHLFYRTRLVEFDVSKDVKNPCSYFSFRTIAEIIAFIGELRAGRAGSGQDRINALFKLISEEKDFSRSLAERRGYFERYSRLCELVLQYCGSERSAIADKEKRCAALEVASRNMMAASNKIRQKAELAQGSDSAVARCRDEIAKIKAEKAKVKLRKELVAEERAAMAIALQASQAQHEEILRESIDGAIVEQGLSGEYDRLTKLIAEMSGETSHLKLQVEDKVRQFPQNVRSWLLAEGFDEAFVRDNCPVEKLHRYLEHRIQDTLELRDPELEALNLKLLSFCSAVVEGCVEDASYKSIVNALNTFLWFKGRKEQASLPLYIDYLKEIAPGYFKTPAADGNADVLVRYTTDLSFNEVGGRYFPPLCATTTCIPAPDSEVFFSDCGESSLRNFINVLIKNQRTGELDASFLLNCKLDVDRRVVDFYAKNSRLDSVKSLRAHNEWAEIVSFLNSKDKSIRYLSPNNGGYCELAAGGKNMLRVVKVLLGTDDIPQICEAVSAAANVSIRCDLSNFHPENPHIEDYENYIRITVDNSQEFYWYFLQQHFRCKTKDVLNQDELFKRTSLRGLCDAYSDSRICLESFCNLTSFFLKEMTASEAVDMARGQGLTCPDTLFKFAFMSKLNSVDSMFDFCMYVLDEERFSASPHVLEMVNNILNSIPDHPVIAKQQRRLVDLVRSKGIGYLDPLVTRWAA